MINNFINTVITEKYRLCYYFTTPKYSSLLVVHTLYCIHYSSRTGQDGS
jgi:hypothetical protein